MECQFVNLLECSLSTPVDQGVGATASMPWVTRSTAIIKIWINRTIHQALRPIQSYSSIGIWVSIVQATQLKVVRITAIINGAPGITASLNQAVELTIIVNQDWLSTRNYRMHWLPLGVRRTTNIDQVMEPRASNGQTLGHSKHWICNRFHR